MADTEVREQNTLPGEESAVDEALFEKLSKEKKKKRRRKIRTGIIIAAVIIGGLAVTVVTLQKRVREQFAAEAEDVQSYAAARGTVSTVVSGSGYLEPVDSEAIELPYGVELDEIEVMAGDTVKEGDVLATVNMASVMTTLATTQQELEDLDDQISGAGNDKINAYISAGVQGRVKKIYVEKGMNIIDCMTDNGALVLISLDGMMALDIDAALEPGTAVTVRCSNGKEYAGKAESIAEGRTTVTLKDDGPIWGDVAEVLDENGSLLGTGSLYIHNQLAVTGYAGTVGSVNVRENQRVTAYSTVVRLTNTEYSANYETLLQTRTKKEKTLNTLIAMMRTGAVTAPFDGTISSIDYTEEDETTTSSSSGYGSYNSGKTTTSSKKDVPLLTMAPDKQMSLTISVDESNILSLELGQTAEVTIRSVSEETFPATVTEISRVGTGSSGVTVYSAVLTMDKAERMLSGMSATAEIRIRGVDNAILIPTDALHQTSTSTFVYTSYNEELKQYGDPVEVTAGISNSSYVEITSGLKEGDVVYYTEKEEDNFFAMMMGGMGSSGRPGGSGSGSGGPSGGFGGGGMPSGGPSGSGGNNGRRGG